MLTQEQYLEIQLIDAQIKQIQQAIQNLDSQLIEVKNLQKSLDEFEGMKGSEEILVSLANGIFAKAALKGNKTLKVNVGNNVVVEKTIAETKQIIDSQMSEISNYRQEMMEQFEKMVARAQELSSQMGRE